MQMIYIEKSQCVVDVTMMVLLNGIDDKAIIGGTRGIVRVMNYRYNLMRLFV